MGNYIGKLGFQTLVFSQVAMHCTAAPTAKETASYQPYLVASPGNAAVNFNYIQADQAFGDVGI
ncbi:hypothetical protein DSO57_1020254 [Entomophthora muscae]|uniref:Uncharacterized protein n=1 Tax=Entomophthora muscae TaxID=34485 RepID=A0ACC2UDF3_9FUNG|nr:hypothetical protein DSO57_1020254 [Entomophthora muscae]